MVLKCPHYPTRITLNVSPTACTVASQLGLEPSSLVWRADFLPIKPSGPALMQTTWLETQEPVPLGNLDLVECRW